jgi:CRISPR-associated protein Csm1
MTSLLFPVRKSDLTNRLKATTVPDLGRYAFFLKGDISGIQSFIFSVRSEKAAQSLKGRSFFVQALSELAVRHVADAVGAANVTVFFNGGGNFYLLLNNATEAQLRQIQAELDAACAVQEFYISLCWMDIQGIENPQFDAVWEELQVRSRKAKLRKLQSDVALFQPYVSEVNDYIDEDRPPQMDYRALGRRLKDAGLQYAIAPAAGSAAVSKNIVWLGKTMTVGEAGNELKDYVPGMPVWNRDLRTRYQDLIRKHQEADDEALSPHSDSIIEFSYLAEFAKQRTGTDKLGVLKMDVDGLGAIFGGITTAKEAYAASTAFGWFFGEFIRDHLLKATFTPATGGAPERFADNLYVVFSGGDDCFFVGAWDAVFEFATRFRLEFEAFAAFITNEVKSIAKPPTISAALLVVDAAFPVVRFAALADEALDVAKSVKDDKGQPLKNSIQVFGQTLSWGEFEYARELALKTADLILNKDESRSLIGRIKSVARQYEALQDSAAGGRTKGPKVWRLFYTMRGLKEKNMPILEKDIQAFSNSLLHAYQHGVKVQYPKFPVAARWAEFLTR